MGGPEIIAHGLYGTERHGRRPRFQHHLLHLVKYVGEVAAIAEDADHGEPNKRARATKRAREFLNGERPQQLVDSLRFLLEDLDRLAGEPTDGY